MKTHFALTLGFGGEFPYENPTFGITYFEARDDIRIGIVGLGYSGCDNNRIEIAFNNSSQNIEKYDVVSNRNDDGIFFNKSDYYRF